MVDFGVDFEVNRVWIFPSLRFLMRPCAFFACMTVFSPSVFGTVRGCSTEWIFQHAQARSSALKRAPARSSALKRAPACSSALQRTPAHLLFAQSPMPVRRAKPSARICQWVRWRSTECRGYLVGAGPMRRQQGAKGDQLGESGRCSEIAVAGLMFAAVG